MQLSDAIKLAIKNRPKWRTGSGAVTTRTNLRHVVDILGKTFDCRKVRVGTFIRLQRELQARKSRRGKPFDPSTINRITSAFHTVLVELEYAGKIEYVPKYRSLEENGPREKYYTREELDLLAATARDMGDPLVAQTILFAYKTGCRQGEIIKLRVSDVDFDAPAVTFRKTKNGKDHTLPLTPELVDLLTELCAGLPDDAAVFPFRNQDQLWNRFVKARNASGLTKDCLFHTIRHTTGTHLAEQGAPLRSIMGVLNHSSTATTLRYAKSTDKSKEEALSLL